MRQDQQNSWDPRSLSWSVLIVVVLGAALRATGLSGKVLWSDEWHTLGVIQLGPWRLVEFLAASWPHLPLNYWAFYGASVLGDSDALLRLPSVIFGSATIYATYRLGTLLLDEPQALLGSLLLALNPLHLMYSRLAVMYALFTLLATWSFYGFFATLRKKGRYPWLGYGIATVLLCYTHYFAFWVILGQLVYLAITWRQHSTQSRWGVLGSLAAAGLVFLPWIAVNYPVLTSFSGKGYWLREFPWFARLGFTLFQFSLGESVAAWNLWVIVPMAVLSGAAGLAGGLAAWRGRAAGMKAVLGIFVGIVLVLSLLGKSTPKHALFLLPLYALIMAAGILYLKKGFPRWLVALGIVAFSGYSLVNYFADRQIADRSMVVPGREVAATIQANEKPGDVVVLSGWTRDRFQRYYGGESELLVTQTTDVVLYGKTFRAEVPTAIHDSYHERPPEEVEREIGKAQRVWLFRVATDRSMQQRWLRYFEDRWMEKKAWHYAPGIQALRGWREGDAGRFHTFYADLRLFDRVREASQ